MSKLISMDKKYKTRDGRDVRVLCTDNIDGGVWTVVAVIDGTVFLYISNGRYYNDKDECELDLVEVPDEKELWIEVYRITKDNKIDIRSFAYASCEALQLSITANRLTYGDKYELIATKKITVAEGESCL